MQRPTLSFLALISAVLALTLCCAAPSVLASPISERASSKSGPGHVSGSTYGVDAAGFKNVRSAKKKLNIVLK